MAGEDFSFSSSSTMDPTSLYNLWSYYQNLAQNQYQWGQQQYAQNSQLTDQIVNDYLGTGAQLTGMAANDLARYQGIFQPLENQLVAQAQSYAGAPRIAAEMGIAGATAAQAAEAGRQNALAQLQSFGIDPSAGRYAALNNADRMQQAASVAGAENTARQQTEATGRQLQGEAIQVGERYPGQITQALQQSLAADQGAINARLANTQSGINLMGSPTQWGGLASGAASNTMTAQYRNRTTPSGFSITEPKPISDGGGGGGGGGGYGGGGGGSPYMPGNPYPGVSASDFGPQPGSSSYYSNYGDTNLTDTGGGGGDGSAWQDDTSGGGDAFAQAGGAIPDVGPPTTGGQVGVGASPSAGAIPDDVPARLTAHEYVVPRDVSLWLGRKHFQNLIDKSRREMTGATARPQMKPALNQQPTFRSQPIGPAIPGAM